jgi:iron complex outermembrane receptor protein
MHHLLNRFYSVIITCILSLGIVSPDLHAQQARIEGVVTEAATEDPVVGANVVLEGTSLGAATGERGVFYIRSVPPGEYTISVSAIGYKSVTRELAIAAEDELNLSFQLEETVIASEQTVEIIGRRTTGYSTDYSFVATKTSTDLREIPQSISIITQKILEDQQVYRLEEASKNISGLNQFSGYNDFTIRGFRSTSTRLVNGLKAGFSFWSTPITPHLDRIEVIKGPASALFANTNPGGTVNLVTKKPLPQIRQGVTFTTGSFNTYRLTSDFTGPMTREGNLLYRLNLGYENADSFRNLQFKESYLIAPSFSFLPSERTRVNVDLVYSLLNTRLDRGQAIFDQSEDLTSTPISFSLSQPSDYMVNSDLYTTVSLRHQFSPNFTFSSSYMKYRYDHDLEEHRTSNVFVPGDSTVLQMAYIRRKQMRTTNNWTNYIVSSFRTGDLQHKLLAGFDYIQQDDNRTQFGARGDDYFIVGDDSLPGGNVRNFDLENPTYTIERNPETYEPTWFSQPWLQDPVRSYTYGFYVQDQVNLHERLKLLLGLRSESYQDRITRNNEEDEIVSQQAFIPRAGLVYQINPNFNIYGTFTQGFQPQDPGTLLNPELTGGPFDPEYSDLYEVGLKSGFLDNRLYGTVSIYHIKKRNILVSANIPGNPERLEQRGAEESEGAEFDLTGQVLPNWNLAVNYAYNNTVITESDNPDEIGQVSENAPHHTAGLWSKYTILRGAFEGIGFGAGLHHVSERNTFDESLQLPAYTVLDAALYYTIEQFQLSLNVKNLTDETYWVGGYNYGRIYPGEPRHLLFKIAYSF